MHVSTPWYIFITCIISMRSYIIPSRSLSTFLCPMAMTITCKAITREGWHMTYKFILPCMGRSYWSIISISPSLRMDPGLSILCISFIRSFHLPHLSWHVGGSILFPSTSRMSSLLSSQVLASGEAVFSHFPFSFGIFSVPSSCSTGPHPCMHVFTDSG